MMIDELRQEIEDIRHGKKQVIFPEPDGPGVDHGTFEEKTVRALRSAFLTGSTGNTGISYPVTTTRSYPNTTLWDTSTSATPIVGSSILNTVFTNS